MGEVYLARHRRLGRLAAIKVLSRELTGNGEMLERFFAEARTTSSIRHPGIVEVSDCDVTPTGAAYIVMEYLEGLTLGRLLARSGPLPLFDLVSVGQQIADAVGAAHGKGIVHRDLKPENIFVTFEPARRIKILDFGIAKLLAGESQGPSLTRTGRLMGTPIYMSPEQCRGAGAVDHRSDIYALGCMLFEMATGRPPFKADSMGELIAAHLTEAPPTLHSLVPQAPAELNALVASMLAKPPAERPGSMQVVCNALNGIKHEPLGATSALDISQADIHQGEALDESAAQSFSGGGGSGMTPSQTALLLPPTQVAQSERGTRLLPTYGKETTFSKSSGELSAPLRSKGRSTAIVAVCAAVVVVAVVAGLSFRAKPQAVTDQATPKPMNESVAVLPEEKIELQVKDAPANLQVIVDGVVSSLPLRLPRSTKTHHLLFRAPGFEPYEVRIDASQNQAIALQMKPMAPAVAPAAAQAVEPASNLKPTPKARPQRRSQRREPSDVFTDI